MMMMRMMMIRAEGNINHSRDCNQWLSGDGQHMLLYSDFSVNNHHFDDDNGNDNDRDCVGNSDDDG